MLAAVERGDVKELAELMRQDPGFKVNMRMREIERTLLHHACLTDRGSAVIPLLLAHPDIDVNLKTEFGSTSFYYACEGGRTSCVREMLKDSRVKVDEQHSNRCTPLWSAAINDHLDTIKWWIASGREMVLGESGNGKTDAIGAAKKYGRTEVVTLLGRFKEHPEETRHAMRVELGWYDALAAEMFALVVFVSDGLLQINSTTPSPAVRYFNIARQLPLELQTILCCRVVGSHKEIIPGIEREVAFKSLAKTLLWSSFFTG